MAQALALARRGVGLASPNPAVGCVIVKNGRVIGRGCHLYDKKDHAEVIALRRALRRAGRRAWRRVRGATLYVTLEPCCISGRTGPCTRAVIAAGIRRVVAATRDPNPRVSGRGLAELRRAGVEVTSGVLEDEAQQLIEPFARWIRTGLPMVTLKVAMSWDGKIARSRNPRSQNRGSVTWITSPASRAEVHRMRHAADAVLTGIGTMLADNPRLTDRSGLPRRRPLLRVILDSRLRLPLRSKLVRSARGDVLVFTCAHPESPRARELRAAGVELVHLHGKRPRLKEVLRELGRRGMLSVLIEGGAKLNAAALLGGVVDKFTAFIAPEALGRGVHLVAGGVRTLKRIPAYSREERRTFGKDFYLAGYYRDVYRNH